MVTSTLPWSVGADFGVGLGVLHADAWSDVDQRLPIHVESSALVIRLFDGGTWARLLGVEGGELVEEYRLFARPSPKVPIDVDFAGQIRLLGYALDCGARDGRCDLQLYWQGQERLETSYTIFAQMLDPAGRVQGQVDAIPQSGGYPTTWWLPGEVVVDSLTLELPPDAPTDLPYRLIVGWYDPITGARLVVSGSDADFVELATVEP